MVNEAHWCFSWIAGLPPTVGAEKAALVKSLKWHPGDTVSISFLDGDPAVQQRLKAAALQWTAPGMANLTLHFKPPPNTAIRISFKYPGSWSVLGTSCQNVPPPQPTMNFGWLSPTTEEPELRRVVLHEFGHALGLIHEHQNPEGGIEWDRERVIEDLSQPPNSWNEEQIETNMFRAFADGEVNASQLDPESIMMYPIPKRWTRNGFSAGLNKELSEGDREFIRKVYPY